MTKKIALSVLAFVLIIAIALGGALFYASKVLTPEKMQGYVHQAVAEAMPGAEVKLKNIELHLGLSVRAEIDELNLQMKKDHSPLAKIEKATLRIPLWAILTGGGTVYLKVQAPNLYYAQLGDSDNWTSVMAKKVKVEVPPTAEDEKDKSASKPKEKANRKGEKALTIPAIAAAVQVDVQVNDLQVHYALKDKSKGAVVIDRLLLKQFGLVNTTAFEMHSNFMFKMANGEEYKLSPMLIGEFNLTDFLKEGQIKSNMQLVLRDITLGQSGIIIPNIKTNFSVSLNQKGEVASDLLTSFGTSKLASQIFVDSRGQITLDKIDVSLAMADLLAMIKGMSLPVDLRAGAANLTVKGKVLVRDGQLQPNINLALTPGFGATVDGIDAAVIFNGSYNGRDYKFHSALELLKGIVSTDINGQFNINQKKIDIAQLPPFKVLAKISNIELSDSFIRGKIYSGKSEVKEASTKEVVAASKGNKVATTAPAPMAFPLLPRGSFDLEMVNLKVGNNALNGKGRVRFENRAVATDFMNFTYGGGQLDLTHQTKLSAHALNNTFKATLRSFNLLALRPFLPSFIDAVTGHFSGVVKGDLVMNDRGMQYAIDTNVQARSGAIKGLQIGKFIETFADKVPMLKGKNLEVDSEKLANYETFSFVGKLSDKVYKVNQVEFIAVNKLVELRGKGEIYPPPTKGMSSLNLTYSDNKYLSRALYELTKEKTLPVLLKGVEFDLMPDYEYSAKVLAKGAGKKAADKAVKKATEILKGNGKKQVNKLLKSFGL